MTETAATPSAPRGPQQNAITYRNPVAAHPITSAACGLLVTAAICGTLIVPIYARSTPKIGDFPFFYFYLLAYMPVVALALWIVSRLQRRLQPPAAENGNAGDAVPEAAR
jgi:hypothetical protein